MARRRDKGPEVQQSSAGSEVESALRADNAPSSSKLTSPNRRLRARREIGSLDARALERLRRALAQLYKQDQESSKYWRIRRSYAEIAMPEQTGHLAWQRACLLHVEAALVEVDPTIDLPYWDWNTGVVRRRTATAPCRPVVASVHGWTVVSPVGPRTGMSAIFSLEGVTDGDLVVQLGRAIAKSMVRAKKKLK